MGAYDSIYIVIELCNKQIEIWKYYNKQIKINLFLIFSVMQIRTRKENWESIIALVNTEEVFLRGDLILNCIKDCKGVGK